MRGRKPQPMPAPNAYAMVPQFMYALLGSGTISPAAFALWAMIRLFARDQERNTFSPYSVALTTMQLAELFGSSETHIKNLIRELEAAQALKRCTTNSSRQLQLCAPTGITGHSIYRLIYLPVTPQEEELAFSVDLGAITPPPEALSSEGGVGGTNYQAPELRVNQVPGNQVPGNQVPGNPVPGNQVPGNPVPGNQMLGNQVPGNPVPGNPVPGISASPKTTVVAILRESGAFPQVAETIADQLLAAGINDPTEVRDLLNTVIQQVRAEGAKETQVIGRVMARLRNGDWNLGTLREQTLAAAQTAAYARYTTADLSDDEGEDDAAEDAGDNSMSAPNGNSLARAAEAAELWKQTLDAIRLSTTAEIYNTWLARSRGLGYNGDGKTLVVETHTTAAVEILTERLFRLVQQGLREVAGAEVPVRFVTAGVPA